MINFDIHLQDDEVATAWLNNAAVRKAIHAEDVSFLSLNVVKLEYEIWNRVIKR